MCDVAHSLLVDQVRALVLAERTAVGFAAAFAEQGAELELPDPDEAVRRFDELLDAEAGNFAGDQPELDPEMRDLKLALGLRL